ncbi:TraB family protein [compost metagenome]
MYQRINVERNDAWLAPLQQRLQAGQGSTLVVVGALHLLGSDGVVEKLRARGYKVERICSACKPEKR